MRNGINLNLARQSGLNPTLQNWTSGGTVGEWTTGATTYAPPNFGVSNLTVQPGFRMPATLRFDGTDGSAGEIDGAGTVGAPPPAPAGSDDGPASRANDPLIYSLRSVGMDDLPMTGGKGANLGNMIQNLREKEVIVPGGFGTSATTFYQRFMAESGLMDTIQGLMKGLDVTDVEQLQTVGKQVRSAILKVDLPIDLKAAIRREYGEMENRFGKNVPVAIRSSATAEDLDDASFAGQQDTYLNRRGIDDVLTNIKKCIASLFTDRAISYRVKQGFDHFKVGLSVVVQRMVKPEASGVAMTMDTETGHPEFILINAVRGLGEFAVGGNVTPDEYIVSIAALREGKHAIVSRKRGNQNIQLVYGNNGGTRVIPVPENLSAEYVLTDPEIAEAAKRMLAIGDHYGKPMDIEWAVGNYTDTMGRENRRMPQFVQARPITTTKKDSVIKEFALKKGADDKPILQGTAVGEGVVHGEVKHVRHEDGQLVVTMRGPDGRMIETDSKGFNKGDILVATFTTPDFEVLMAKAGGIITDDGSRTCHAAIIAREFGIPTIVGTSATGQLATKALQPGQKITLSTAEGPVGNIYKGAIPVEVSEINAANLPKTKTKIGLIVGQPDLALKHGMTPGNDGVALLREEFLALELAVHPLVISGHRDVQAEIRRQMARIERNLAELVETVQTALKETTHSATKGELVKNQVRLDQLLVSLRSGESHVVDRLRLLHSDLTRVAKRLTDHRNEYPRHLNFSETVSQKARRIERILPKLIDQQIVFEGDPTNDVVGLKERSRDYDSPREWYVLELARGIAKIARSFGDKPVKLRLSDFKSNEFKGLLGGTLFEPNEEEPMMGHRGASRYYSDWFRPAFNLELEAIEFAMRKYGVKNIQPFVPMMRTPEELDECLTLMAGSGIDITTHPVGFMVEVPSTAYTLDLFNDVFERRGVKNGFISIGSNDLTQFTLANSRNDSYDILGVTDEMAPAVTRTIKHILSSAAECQLETGICGQGPSDKPELVELLVSGGINSIGVNVDVAIVARVLAAMAEQKLLETDPDRADAMGIKPVDIDPELKAYAMKKIAESTNGG